MARSAAQRAALKKAQAASAAKRRGRGHYRSQHYYGKGLTGRRNAHLATYGSKRHGLSIAQQTRRRQRRNRIVKRVSQAGAAAGAGFALYQSLDKGQKAKVHDFARTGATKVKYHTKGMKMKRQIKKHMKKGY